MSTTDTPPRLTKINLKELSEIKRTKTGTATDTTYPIYYYIIGKNIGVIGQDGAPVAEDCTITLWYTRTPLSTEALSDSVLPIVDSRWDTCMVFGACFELTADLKWYNLFRSELDRLRSLQMSQNSRSDTIETNTDYE